MSQPSPPPPHLAVSAHELLEMVEAQLGRAPPRLGQALMAMGSITEPDLASALAAQRREQRRLLGEHLLEQGRITPEVLDTALNLKLGFPAVDALRFPIEPEALARLPLELAQRLNALPLMWCDGQLLVALADPKRQDHLDEIAWAGECWVQPVWGDGLEIRQRLLALSVDAARGPGSAAQAGGSIATSTSTARPSPNANPGHAGPLATDARGTTAPARGAVSTGTAPADGSVPAPNPWAGHLMAAQTDDVARWLADLERGGDAPGLQETDNANPERDHALVKLLNSLIAQAHALGASDVHIESAPGREPVRIRIRCDGRLRPLLELPHSLHRALVARVKIMAGLDVSERRRPQDGRINFARHAPGHELELRVVTLPTHQGLEDVVMRLLTSSSPLPLERLGLDPATLERLVRTIERPHGLMLCAGPTGSGKTTTLHAVLAHLNEPHRKIWTAEDPVELTQPGLRQVQVDARLGWTFDKALRTFLRADPDVIMVGEIRDRETARTAVEAALTGHLVLSTIHTNSAAETVTRLLDIGLDPFHFGDSLLAVLGQRLVRRWCSSCLERQPAREEEIESWVAAYRRVCTQRIGQVPEHARMEHDDRDTHNQAVPDAQTVRARWLDQHGLGGRLWSSRAAGCAACHGTGWQGRIGLYELLEIGPGIRRLIQQRAPAGLIEACAASQGFRTLWQDGLEKVLQGLTSLEEVQATLNP